MRFNAVKSKTIIVLCVISIFFGTVCSAEEPATKKPLWEIGLAGAAARLPHYRGSDEYRWWILPVPYLIYRGDTLKATREGLRGVFLNSDYLEGSISLSGNPPVASDNKARKNMPELDAIFQVGPSLKLFLVDRNLDNQLYLRNFIRLASSVNLEEGLSLAYQGLDGGIDLVYRNRQFYKPKGLILGLIAGVKMSDKKLNSYFYDVPEEYATSKRSHYESKGGYAGFSISFYLRQDITKSVSIGFYSRWDNIDGAVYEDSPLVRKKNNITIGCGLLWTLGSSSKRVISDDEI